MRIRIIIALVLSLCVALSHPSNVSAQSRLTTICQFNAGPKAGTTFDFRPYGVQPIPVGSPCQDGQGSTGVAVAAGSSPSSTGGNPGGKTTVCQFSAGPKAGTTFDFRPYGVQPIPVGSPCQDGQGSTGVAIAAGSSSSSPGAMTAPLTQPQARSTDSRTCSNQCNATRDQCVANCGQGPDRANNPNWAACRHACRDRATECRDTCTSSDSEE
jgi:hypothetical protein